jgi:hypothetical protein
MTGPGKSIQTNRGGMADAKLRGIFAKNAQCKKVPDTIFYSVQKTFGQLSDRAKKRVI